MTVPVPVLPDLHEVDVYEYVGSVSKHGYQALCAALSKKRHEHAILCLTTYGGDPDAAFRIARAMQHEYPENGFVALISGYCKSAGTLIVTGAKALYMADMSELGPLDIQVRKGDELFARNSGLEIIEAITFLQNQTLTAFRAQARSLTLQDGLSTRVAADIATRLTRGIFEPIAAQIDPIKLAEMQRANDITMGYGFRLAQAGDNITQSGLAQLIGGYPSHGFVIDRKEARSIFTTVLEPSGQLLELSNKLMETDPARPGMHPPQVQYLQPPQATKESDNEPGQHQTDGHTSAAPGDDAINANGTGNPKGQRGVRVPSGNRKAQPTTPGS